MIIFKDYKLLDEKEHIELLNLRNSDYIRESSNNKKIILLETHMKWVQNLDNNQKYFAVFYDNKIIGGVNFKFKKNEVYEWGIFFQKINPIITFQVFCICLEFLFERFETLYSEVLKNNQKAFEFNLFFGIKPYKEDKEKYYMKISKIEWIEKKQKIVFCKKNINYKFLEKKCK